MTEITLAWFYGINIASAALILAAGAFAFFRLDKKSHLALSLFLVATGAHLVLNNAAPNTADLQGDRPGALFPSSAQDMAEALFMLSHLFLPLQGLLLLAYAYSQAGSTHPRIQLVCKIGAFVALGFSVSAFLVALVDQSLIFTVTLGSGAYTPKMTALGSILFQFPQIVGSALALGLLAYMVLPSNRPHWSLLSGLTLAVGYTFGLLLSYRFKNEDYRWAFWFLLAAMLVLMLIVPGLMWVRQKAQELQANRWRLLWPIALAAILLFSCFVALFSDWYRVATAPGLARMAALAFFIVPALRHAPLHYRVRAARAIPFVGAVMCNLGTSAVVVLVSLTWLAPSWMDVGAGLALAGMIVTAIFAIPTTLNVLRPSPPLSPSRSAGLVEG